jgi:16S rRNA (adenine1518-N6/adenine1519-N6)-dimethyltransferase
MVRTKKSLGQNFLMHARIAERIALSAELPKNGVVFEIGPGTGMLTRELLKLSKKVIALEADQELFEKLKEDFKNEIRAGHLELLHGDIRTFYVDALPKGYALVANIPYYLTGEIFRMFLSAKNHPSSMTLLVQKEVARRIVGKSEARGQKIKESILSLSVKAFGTPTYLFTVPRGAFVPAPNVDSAALGIKNISRKAFKTQKQEQKFFDLIHSGFAHKRKFARNNLVSAGTATQEQLDSLGIDPKARAEDIPISIWLTLASI